MRNRWTILALLFAIRVTMTFQFQAAAALSPFVMESYGVGLAEIGFLIGLYLSPGIILALPGGAIGRWLGDKRAVAFGMLLMLVGGLVMTLMPAWEAQVAGRLISGVGGVVLNVLMSKMVTDWFQNGQLATAMGIFVNSWPVGIAAALLVLPPIAGSTGLAATFGMITGTVLIGLVALLLLYRDPEQDIASGTMQLVGLDRSAKIGLFAAAFIWGLYNASLAMVFSFGPTLLVERGWDVPRASYTTSITLWIVAISVPLGGFLADRWGQRDPVLAGGLILFAALMFVAPYVSDPMLVFIGLGLVGGLSAGPIMSLPAKVLAPANRAMGMGLFFTVYYGAIFLAPLVAGHMAAAEGSAAVTFTLGGVLLLICLGLLLLFRMLAREPDNVAPARARD
jgi:MFS family permease